MFDSWRGFKQSALADEWRMKLTEMARKARGDILKMTTVSGSGHPGGSMSSIEIFLTLYNMAKVDPTDPRRDDRDRIIVSHGHTSPGVYAALAAAGFFDIYPALHGFRQAGSPFEGHVEQSVPGIEWDTGNLGQGLSVGVGKAMYGRLSGQDFHTYVVMGDGEQQKGQISEARRMAVKYDLRRLTAIVDYNRLQITGKITDVMPQQIRRGWESDGWQVVEVDGHDLDQVYVALHRATHSDDPPMMILARTVMGKGVSFMENDENFHGAAVKPERIGEALEELGIEGDDVETLEAKRSEGPPAPFAMAQSQRPEIAAGSPITYGVNELLDNRSAWGNALLSVAEANVGRDGFVMAVFDNDLAGSVKTGSFAAKYPDNFFQCGISEHNTATAAGALSTEKAISIWADFGVFGIDETYNQARLNDINHCNLKLFCTHSGINVGEDGKTHQCIDYFGLLNSTFGWKVITPADPNQTDRVVRHVLATAGNFAVIMGRSKVPIVTDDKGEPFFAEGYVYRYGRMETIRSGEEVALVCSGNILSNGLDAWRILNDDGVYIRLVSVSDWSDLHPDDIGMLAAYRSVVTLEDHNVKTGLGAAIAAAMLDSGLSTRLVRLGIDRYGSSGKPADLYKQMGLDGTSVSRKVKSLLKESVVRQ
jgi:transketolase